MSRVTAIVPRNHRAESRRRLVGSPEAEREPNCFARYRRVWTPTVIRHDRLAMVEAEVVSRMSMPTSPRESDKVLSIFSVLLECHRQPVLSAHETPDEGEQQCGIPDLRYSLRGITGRSRVLDHVAKIPKYHTASRPSGPSAQVFGPPPDVTGTREGGTGTLRCSASRHLGAHGLLRCGLAHGSENLVAKRPCSAKRVPQARFASMGMAREGAKRFQNPFGAASYFVPASLPDVSGVCRRTRRPNSHGDFQRWTVGRGGNGASS
ncbi:hypothetical protein CSOJ01_02885 [Colletotrichum sojae]|uniref:Uncharacterized protein n=1 Tax=Colletotrichum sojae TaxID=2175907 RepID=A0A8H6JPV6_9PEZI|nr:hypothetical protein CSOJ01_02885 [Colletotrichum sojae]